MKFLCDVHISYKIVSFFKENGYEAIHVNTILNSWYTKDSEISEYADNNDFIILSKDSDFRESYFIKHTPKKLIKLDL